MIYLYKIDDDNNIIYYGTKTSCRYRSFVFRCSFRRSVKIYESLKARYSKHSNNNLNQKFTKTKLTFFLKK